MVFIGYEPGSKAYRVYDPATRRVHVTRDVVFDETASWDWEEKDGGTGPSQDFVVEFTVDTPSNNSTAHPPPAPAHESEEEVNWDTSDQGGTASPRTPPPPPATEERSIEFATPPVAPDPEQLDANDGGEPHRYRRVSDLLGPGNITPGLAERLLLTTTEEPSSVGEALKEASWSRAMAEELAVVEENETWSLVDLPPGHKPIGLKCVYKAKKNEKGHVINSRPGSLQKGTYRRRGLTSTKSSLQSPASTPCASCSPSPRNRDGRSTTST